jgi:hypothetical protein
MPLRPGFEGIVLQMVETRRDGGTAGFNWLHFLDPGHFSGGIRNAKPVWAASQ